MPFNKVKALVQGRKVPVDFSSYPDNPIDESLFHAGNYQSITSLGFTTTPLRIMISAMVHYQGRYPSSVSKRFLNSFIELNASIKSNSGSELLFFKDVESNEFQTRSSEVIGVGLCIDLASKLFNVRKNRFGLVEGSGKRCDFFLIKNGQEYILESKGRKGSITSAIKDVFSKKENYSPTSPKYGFISRIPRGTAPTSMLVIDPEITPNQVPRTELIRRLLVHYSKVSDISGFWRLSEALLARAKAIGRGDDISNFENRQLDYGNVMKLGRSIEFSTDKISSRAFFPPSNDRGLRVELGDYIAFFPIEQRLLELLEAQNYEGLIEYELGEDSFDTADDTHISPVNDGSMGVMIRAERLRELDR